MRKMEYQFKFFLNATHSVQLNGTTSARHPHTWEIMLRVGKQRDDFVQFEEVERLVEEFLSGYQERYLNEIPPFHVVNPIQENLCEYFRTVLIQRLLPLGWELRRIAISETPIHSYVIDLAGDGERDRMLLFGGSKEREAAFAALSEEERPGRQGEKAK